MGRKCEFYTCGSLQGNGNKTFFSFPKSEVQCAMWVEACNSPEAAYIFKSDGVQAFRKKKICSDHFAPKAFKDASRKHKGLLPGALPMTCRGFANMLKNEHYNSSEKPCVEYLNDDPDFNVWRAKVMEEQEIDDGKQHRKSPEERLLQIYSFERCCVESTTSSTNEERGDECMKKRELLGQPEDEQELITKQELGAQENVNQELMCEKTNEELLFSLDGLVINQKLPGRNEEFAEELEQEQLVGLSEHNFGPVCSSYSFFQLAPEEDQVYKGNNQIHEIGAEEGQCLTSFSSRRSHQEAVEQLLNVEKEANQNLKQQLKIVRRQLFVSKQTSDRRLEAAKRSKRVVAKLRTELKTMKKRKSAAEKLGEQAAGNPIIRDSLKNASRHPKARRYHPATMKFAAGIYLNGPRTYRYMRNSKHIVLPHKTTVYNYNRNIRLEPGLNKIILNRIGKKTKLIRTKKEKIVMVCLDGMSLKSDLTYCSKSDTFYGFPNHGIAKKIEKNDPSKLATEAIVVMVSGMYRSFKQPIGYLLAHNSLGSRVQMNLVKKSIRAVRSSGLIPLALVMDQSTTNQKMVREAGVSAEQPIMQVDNKDIAVMFDSPHLLKNARNAIYKHNAVFNKKIASFDHLKLLYDADTESTLRLAPKLHYKSINLPPFSRMNVAMATRTLSESCAIAIQHYVEAGTLPKESLQTSAFVALHDKLFDTFNSKKRYSDSIGKPYRAPITDQSVHLNFLEETLQIFKTMYYTSKACFDVRKARKESKQLTAAQRNPAYLKGFIGNIHALLWIWNIVKTKYRCTYLCTNPLCQDCLENFFSDIRRRCGFNDAPNVFQFSSAFKYAMITASNDSNEGRNCQDDKVPSLLNEKDLEQISMQDLKTNSYEFEPLDVDTLFEFHKKDLNALVYILGAAVNKLHHKKCREQLKATQDDDYLQNEDYSFSKLKAQASTRMINIPNTKLYDIGIVAFAVFNRKFKKFLYENRKGVRERMKQYITYEQFGTSICKGCFKKLMDFIFNTFIQGFLREIRFKNKLAQNNKRRTKRNRKAFRMNLPVPS